MVLHSPRPSLAKSSKQPEGTPRAALPEHVAVIMDGNGRWAKQRGLSRQAGHRAGTENLRKVIQAFGEAGVKCLTLFAFSTENWGRPRREVSALLRLIGRVIDRELQSLHEKNVRLLHLGSLEPLSPDLQRRVRDAIDLTKDNDGLTVCVAFNYGGRAEIVDAVRRIVSDGVDPANIDEALVSCYLNTNRLPDPDLVIRTAGEMRLSNFLIWQSAYAEYYFTPVYWPDFNAAEVANALQAYAERDRRFGAIHTNGSESAAPQVDGAVV